jgi:hypothetical protein
MPTNKSKSETPWRDSQAKCLLVEGLTAGTIPLTSHDMPPKEVYNLHDEFKQFKYANFRTNLNNLRKDFIDRRKRSAFDEAALKNDRQLVQRGTQTHRGYPFWPETEASKLLEIDLKEGKHRQMKPAALYTTRPEYQVFPLDVFRDHVHQELRSQRERPYWLHKKEQRKKQARGENILEDKGDNEEAGNVLF